MPKKLNIPKNITFAKLSWPKIEMIKLIMYNVEEYEFVYVYTNLIEFTNNSTNLIDVLNYVVGNHEEGVHTITLLL